MSTLKESQISNTSSPLDWIYSVYQVVGLQKFEPHPPNYDNQSRPFQNFNPGNLPGFFLRNLRVTCETGIEKKCLSQVNVVQKSWSSPHLTMGTCLKKHVFFWRNSLLVYIQQRSTAIMAFKSQILTDGNGGKGWHLRVAMTCFCFQSAVEYLGGGFKYFLFSSQLGEDSHFD